MANGIEGFENFYFALGEQQPCVVQRRRGGVGEARESEEVVIVEVGAVQFVDGLDDADERAAIHDGRRDQRMNERLSSGGVALGEARIVRISEADTFAIVGQRPGKSLAWFQHVALENRGVNAGLVH